MEELFHLENNNLLAITIYAMEYNGNYYNIFTLARNRSDIISYGWKKFSPRKKTKRFDACFPNNEGVRILEKISSERALTLNIGRESFNILFGPFQKRPPVFIPNQSRQSIANGWWPGTLTGGFTMEQWFCSGKGIEVKLHNDTIKDIQKHLGVQIEKLSDFVHSVIRISSPDTFSPTVSFNPDNQNVFFYLSGSVPQVPHRIVMLLGEGEEAIIKIMLDLPAGKRHFFRKVPFEPTRLGYELYQLSEEGNWKLISSMESKLVRSISISTGLLQGKLKVIHGDNEETYDIVSNNKPIVIDDSNEGEKQPWIQAEADRNRINRSVELDEVGSIFVKFEGPNTQAMIQKIIKEKIFEPETDYILIWDPYLDGSVLPSLMIQAMRYPGIDIRLLLSENEAKSSDEPKNPYEINLNQFQRCASIVDAFNRHTSEPINNIQARNWYRSGDHVFHDRFIITSRGVWQLGSSLKDLGNYHTTIYRLEGKLPEQVKDEFERAWEGDFNPMKPSGFQLIPQLQRKIRKDENA